MQEKNKKEMMEMKLTLSAEELKLFNRLLLQEIKEVQAELLDYPIQSVSDYYIGLTRLHKKVLSAVRRSRK